MDKAKLEERTIEQINESLPIQHLSRKIAPESVLGNRDRYYLVQCTVDGKKDKLLFLRYEDWFFYIHGLKEIPKHKPREYNAKVRIPKPDDSEERRKEKEKAEKEMLKRANDALKNIGIVRTRDV